MSLEEKESDLVKRLLDILIHIMKHQSMMEGGSFSHGEMALMHLLSRNMDEECTPSMMSSQLRVTRPTITSALNSLEKKGYIIREDLADRRKISVKLTGIGERYLTDKYEELVSQVTGIFGAIGQEDSLKLVEILEKVEVEMKKNLTTGERN